MFRRTWQVVREKSQKFQKTFKLGDGGALGERALPLVPARWRVLGAAFRRAGRVMKSRTHQCQRSTASPFYRQDEIIIPNHLGENKGE